MQKVYNKQHHMPLKWLYNTWSAVGNKPVYAYKPVGRGYTGETSGLVLIAGLVATGLSCSRHIWFWGRPQIWGAFWCTSVVFPLHLWNCWRTQHSDLWLPSDKTKGEIKMNSYMYICIHTSTCLYRYSIICLLAILFRCYHLYFLLNSVLGLPC